MPLQQKSITHFASLSELSTVCDAKNSSSRFFKFKTVILILKPPISYSFCFIKCRTAFMYNKKKSVNSSYFCISLVRTHQYSSGRVSESEWVSEKRLKKWDGGMADCVIGQMYCCMDLTKTKYLRWFAAAVFGIFLYKNKMRAVFFTFFCVCCYFRLLRCSKCVIHFNVCSK